jgi:purine nucleosidase
VTDTPFPVLPDDLRAALLAEPDPTAGPVDVVIDTDVTNEIDDQFAIVWALLRPDRLRVRALHAVPYAHDPVALAEGPLLSAMTSAQLRAARAAGTLDAGALPTITAAEGAANAHAELLRIAALTGFPADRVVPGATGSLPADGGPAPSPAAEDLVRLAREPRDGPLYVLGMGGATNLASALLLDPGIVERIVVVWTSAYPSFWPYENVSYNLGQDLAASRLLLDSGVPLVYLPGFYVGEELRISLADVRAHVAGRGPLGDYLAEVYEGHRLTQGPPGRTKVIWDLICVAWLLDPSWLVTRLVPTPGLAPDLRWTPRTGAPLMREAHDVDRDAVVTDLYARLAEAAGEAPAPDGPPSVGGDR